MWEQHLKGRHDWHHQLWPILMFQAWLHGPSGIGQGSSA